MDVAEQIFWRWLLMNACIQPFIIALTVSIGRTELREKAPRLFWTRASEAGSHPLLKVRKGVLHYLGGDAHPLPKKFAVLTLPFWPLWVIGLTLCHSAQTVGISFWVSVGIMIAVILAFSLPVLWALRRLQTKWLRDHLATLPADVAPACDLPDAKPALG